MDAVIGRDGQTSQLDVAVGQKIYRFFAPGSVPTDVSRQHCIVTVHGDGSYTVRNIKAANVTYVNGVEIEEKAATDADRIELGRSRYLLNLAYILGKLIPQRQQAQKETDISPLEKIWDDYNAGDLRLQKHQRNIGLLSSIPMGFSLLGGLVTGVSTAIRPYALVFTAIALIFMVYGFYKRFTDHTLEKRQQLKLDFQQHYVCPNPECRHSLGNTPFVSLQRRGQCPYCKIKYKDIKQPRP